MTSIHSSNGHVKQATRAAIAATERIGGDAFDNLNLTTLFTSAKRMPHKFPVLELNELSSQNVAAVLKTLTSTSKNEQHNRSAVTNQTFTEKVGPSHKKGLSQKGSVVCPSQINNCCPSLTRTKAQLRPPHRTAPHRTAPHRTTPMYCSSKGVLCAILLKLAV